MDTDPHIAETSKPLTFLRRLDVDRDLADRCAGTDLEGRLRIAQEVGLPFDEGAFRLTVRTWDLAGGWNKWLAPRPFAREPDKLPSLTSDYPLTEEQLEAYRRDGYVVLRDTASRDELEPYREVIRGVVSNHDAQSENPGETVVDRGFLQIISMRTRDAGARRLVLARRYAKIAADLLGVDAVRVYFDQALYKEPGSKFSHWHQDHLYFPVATDKVVTLWLPLVDIADDMGVLVYAAGSQELGYIGYKPDKGSAESEIPEFVSDYGYPIRDTGPMAVGDVAFHDGWVLHGARANKSDRIREVISVTYYADGAPICEPENPFQARAIEIVYAGQQPGEVAASPLTPLAYSKEW